MPTVKDVARHAGVSVGTVSKVLSKDQTVKEALRSRVMTAVSELGYKPNLAARALRTNKINVLGLVVPDITNPFFASLAKDVETLATERQFTVMLTNSHDDAQIEKRQIEALLDQNPHGLIVAASNDASDSIPRGRVPIVSVDRRLGSHPLITTDHAGGSAKIIEHLVSQGHRRIAYLAGPQNTEVGRLRLAGIKTSMSEQSKRHVGLDLMIRTGTFDYESGEQCARELLALPIEQRPTAIAAANDQMAIGVLRAANDMNIRVPTELSVAGFDNIALAELMVPRLTTLAQPIRELAAAAVTQVLEGDPQKITDAVIPGELIVRGSTASI